jgi:hypothetical protein
MNLNQLLNHYKNLDYSVMDEIIKKTKKIPNYIPVGKKKKLTSAKYNLQRVNVEHNKFYNKTEFDSIYKGIRINNMKFMEVETGIIGIAFMTHENYPRLKFKINDDIEYPTYPNDLTGNFLYLPGTNHPITRIGDSLYIPEMRYYERWYLGNSIFTLVSRGQNVDKILDKEILNSNSKNLRYVKEAIKKGCKNIKGRIGLIIQITNLKHDLLVLVTEMEIEKQKQKLWPIIDDINCSINPQELQDQISYSQEIIEFKRIKRKEIKKNKKSRKRSKRTA